MTIAFSCPGCGKQFKVSDNMAGRKAKCSACATIMLVPTAEAFAAAPSRQAPPPEPEYAADEPVPRRKKSKKKSRTGLMLALLGVLLTTCVCCGGVGGFFGLGYFNVWDPLSLFGGLGSEAKYLPDNCLGVMVINYDQMRESDAFKQLRSELPAGMREEDLNKTAPIPSTNINRIVVGLAGDFGAPQGPEVVAVIKTKTELSTADLQKAAGPGQPRQEKAKDYTIYVGEHGAVCKIDDNTILFSSRAESIKKVIARDKKPDFSPGLKAAMKQANFSKSVSFAMDFKGIKKSLPQPGGGPGRPPAPGPANPFQSMSDVGEKSEGMGGYVHFGKDLELDLTVLCTDGKTAEDIKNMAAGGISAFKGNLPAELKKIVEDIKITASGSNVSVKATWETETLLKAIRAVKSKPFMPFGQVNPGWRVADARPKLSGRSQETPPLFALLSDRRSVAGLESRSKRRLRTA